MLKYRTILSASVVVYAVLTAGPIYAGPYKAPYDIQVHKTAQGDILTDSKGMALYTFSKDSKGVSTCTGGCATNWPPLKADEEDKPVGDFTIITRADGSKQWAHDGMPLYRFKKDTKPGQVNGNGIGGMWHVAKPS